MPKKSSRQILEDAPYDDDLAGLLPDDSDLDENGESEDYKNLPPEDRQSFSKNYRHYDLSGILDDNPEGLGDLDELATEMQDD